MTAIGIGAFDGSSFIISTRSTWTGITVAIVIRLIDNPWLIITGCIILTLPNHPALFVGSSCSRRFVRSADISCSTAIWTNGQRTGSALHLINGTVADPAVVYDGAVFIIYHISRLVNRTTS